MIKRYSGFLVFCFLFIQNSWAGTNFTELYEANGVWKVDLFEIKNGKLQDFISSRSFLSKLEAQDYQDRIDTSDKSRFEILSTEAGTKPLWIVTNSWNETWEEKYAKWVGENFNKDYFLKNSLATDCADVAYSLRWIFSRNNGLPAAATLSGSGAIVTHMSAKSEWNNLPSDDEWQKDKRFLAGLNWLLDNVYTKTLYKDTFPVEISKSTIRPGLINLIGGHTEVFRSVSYRADEIPIEVLYSTLPKEVRTLAERPFFDSIPIDPVNGGLLRFRWPVLKESKWSMIPKEAMPFYSMEQYEPNLCESQSSFALCIIQKLGMKFDRLVVLDKFKKSVISSFKQREEVVEGGFAFCQKNDCSPGTMAYEDWSTPARDKRLANMLEEILPVMYEINVSFEFDEWMRKEKFQGINLSSLAEHLKKDFLSYDPRDSLDGRWGKTKKDIYTTVKSKIESFQKSRDLYIEKASKCRSNIKECKNSKNMLSELSTVGIDFLRRKLAGDWLNYCHVETCIGDFDNKIFERIWFESPAPWDPIELRIGASKELEDFHVLYASSVSNGGSNVLILDNKDVYLINKREKVTLSEKAFFTDYNDHTELFYTFDGMELVTYSSDFKTRDKLDIGSIFGGDFTENRLVISSPVEIGESKIIVYDQLIGKGLVVDLKHLKLELEFSFNDFQKIENGFLLKGKPDKLLELRDGKVLITEFNYPDKDISNVDILSDGHYLLRFENSSDYYLQTPYGTTPMGVSAGSSYSERLNSHLTLMLIYDDMEKSFFLDNEGSIVRRGNWFSAMKNGKTQLLLNIINTKSKLFLLRDEANPEELPLEWSIFNSLVGFTEDWISYENMGSSTVIDYTGKILKKTSTYSVSECSSYANKEICKSNDTNLFVNHFKNPETNENSPDMYQIGRAEDFEVEGSSLYVLKKNSNSSRIYFMNGIKSGSSDVGSAIKVSEGIYLWKP